MSTGSVPRESGTAAGAAEAGLPGQAGDPERTSCRQPALFSLGGLYRLSENLGVGTGINNPFDKRQFREGNALVAGAHTYNEPGRTFSSLNLSF